MLKNRLVVQRLQSIAEDFPVVVISGARQVGKTTLLKDIVGPSFDYIVFDPVQSIGNIKEDPDLFLNNHKTPLILDEIQYAPEVVASIKRKVDKNRLPGLYYLTGSQQWGIIKCLSESLADRAAFVDLYPFSLIEIASIEKFSPWLEKWLNGPDTFLEQKNQGMKVNQLGEYEQIWRGFMPHAQTVKLTNVPQFHQGYQRTYIERDIHYMSDVGDWALFGRFIKILAALTAQEINYSQIGREIGVNPLTAKRWIELLKACFQYYEIPAFSMNSIKKISGKAKGYCIDTGSICHLQAIPSPTSLGGHPLWGALFETAVVSEIKKQASAMVMAPNFYHWRSHSGAEVDLILEWNGQFFPIEIKGKTHPSRVDTRGISAFRETYPRLNIAKGLIICPCEQPFPLNEKDWALPWDWALKNISK